MGANFDFRVFEGNDRKKLTKQWVDAVELSSYDDGHQYSGCIGMMPVDIVWRDVRLPSIYAASEYVENNHEKWEPPIAASFTTNGKVFWLIGGLCAS